MQLTMVTAIKHTKSELKYWEVFLLWVKRLDILSTLLAYVRIFNAVQHKIFTVKNLSNFWTTEHGATY